MRVMSIYHDSTVDGEGLRTVIFFAGCPHKCKGCHNPESWNMANGTEMTIEEILEEVKSNPLNDVTFSGGDPFLQAFALVDLAKEIKALGKTIWTYTGFTIEQIMNSNIPCFLELVELSDVIVDGPYREELRDTTLAFRGSSNQQIIQVKDYLKEKVDL